MVKLATDPVPTELLVDGRCQLGGNGVFYEVLLLLLCSLLLHCQLL